MLKKIFIILLLCNLSKAASLMSCATGNFTDAATWALVDSTSLLDSEASSVTVTTSYTYTATFTPGAITVDGIAIKLRNRTTSPSGTVTVQLYNNTDAAEVKTVTLNVSDLPNCDTTNKEGGWIFFKFDASTLLIAAKAYKIGVLTSASSQITTFRNATTNNHSRLMRTTTTQAPAAGDTLHVLGEHTGAGAGNDITVTMNSTDNTDYGPGSDTAAALTISKRGTLSYGTSAATNYYLKLSGDVFVYNGGTLNIGTIGSEIPRDSSAIFELDPVASGGIEVTFCNGSAISLQGLSRTIGKNIVTCKLNTDEAAGQVALGVDTDTGWLNGDNVAIASTSRTSNQYELRILSGNAGATSFDITVALTNAHSGTAPTQAEIILLTRNIQIRSTSSGRFIDYIIQNTANVDIDWAEIYYSSYLNVETTTGSFNIAYSSLHDTQGSQTGISCDGAAINNITIDNCVFYNVGNSACYAISLSNTSGTSLIITNNTVIASYKGFYIRDYDITFTDNIATSCGFDGFWFYGAGDGSTTGTFENLISHSNGRYGIYISGMRYGTLSNLTIWRNGSSSSHCGIRFDDAAAVSLIFDGLTLFGNHTNNILYEVDCYDLIFVDVNAGGDTSFDTEYNITFNAAMMDNISKYISADFTGSGIVGGEAANTADIRFNTTTFVQNNFDNCDFGATTYISQGTTYMLPLSYIKSAKYLQVSGIHRSDFREGTIETDTTYFNTASPSQKLTPASATYKLKSGGKVFAIANGNTATVSCYVRKSSVAEGGAAYNGTEPRLILKRNAAMGITADTVLDTMTMGLNEWEQLTGETPAVTDNGCLEVMIDCDGTAGFINIDDWEVL